MTTKRKYFLTCLLACSAFGMMLTGVVLFLCCQNNKFLLITLAGWTLFNIITELDLAKQAKEDLRYTGSFRMSQEMSYAH